MNCSESRRDEIFIETVLVYVTRREAMTSLRVELGSDRSRSMNIRLLRSRSVPTELSYRRRQLLDARDNVYKLHIFALLRSSIEELNHSVGDLLSERDAIRNANE